MSALFASTDLVVPFDKLRISDVDAVGGKNASLGELISHLAPVIQVPAGFAITAHAFRSFFEYEGLGDRIHALLNAVHADHASALAHGCSQVQAMVLAQPFPPDCELAIRVALASLSEGHEGASFAVRPSDMANDLLNASFARPQASFLNVNGIENVLHKVRAVYASLYNDGAVRWRVHQGLAHETVVLSVGVQRMVRSDLASAGRMVTLDTESGFDQVVQITSSYGLGEVVAQAAVHPDVFYVHKPMLRVGKQALIRRSRGTKLIQMQLAETHDATDLGQGVTTSDVPPELRNRYSLSDADVHQLARYALMIEAHFGRAMDMAWAKDGRDGGLYILQARPETSTRQAVGKVAYQYSLNGRSAVLAQGRAIGQKIGIGTVRVVHSLQETHMVQSGDVLVTDMTDPNWEPVMKRASAIVTNRGGRTCHAAIVARELGIPAVVGCGNADRVLTDGMLVTVSCAQGDTGFVYDGLLGTEVTQVQRGQMPDIGVQIMMNVGNPQLAFDLCQLPNAGVGLARLEFIINNSIGIHPKAVLDYPNIDPDLKQAVESIARGHASPRAFYVDRVAEGVATIAAAFWPKPVIVRLSDFKSNGYRKLIGGSRYEPEEENPMLGFRGAARYLSADFAQAFAMECEALKRVRDDMGLTNVQIMVPFVRTVAQARQVTDLLKGHGLQRGVRDLKLVMMCEVPSNALLANDFLPFFDGFSIGSNDLTQLTLGLDSGSELALLAKDFDERDPAVMALIRMAITACRTQGKYIGICGQGPSEHPDFARWLMQEGISSISLNPDALVATWQTLATPA